MYRVGQKVTFNEVVGYIVRIEINPMEEREIALNESAVYVIRRFGHHYYGGYIDFYRLEGEFEVID